MKKTIKKYFIHGHRRLCYRTYGRGGEVTLAFHGYGQDHRAFRTMGERLGDRYTLYSIDLFFHGNSSWLMGDEPLSKEEWCDMIGHFLQDRGIARYSLMGYSLGGRFVLALVECFAERIDQLILIAPDGIKPRFWYRSASTTMLGNYLLRTSVLRPSFFFTIIRVAHRFKLADQGTLKFVTRHMDTRKRRYAVYRRWTMLRRIQPDLPTVTQRCNQEVVRVTLYLGQYDRIVKAPSALLLHKNLNNSSLYYLPSGHTSLISAAAQHLK